MNISLLALAGAAGAPDDPEAVGVVLLLIAAAIIWPILFTLLKESVQMRKERRLHRRLTGTVIENNLCSVGEDSAGRNVPAEWIVFEDEVGRKHRFQNTKRIEILLRPGDQGVLEIWGKTIFDFQKKSRDA